MKHLLVATIFLALSVSPAMAADRILPITAASEEGKLPKLHSITTNEAKLSFVTRMPLACTVVYGESKDYGTITNDPQMPGTATINHNPVLTDLRPDTLYHFRVQGIAVDGTIFKGEDRTFRTAALSASTEVNLAALSQGAKVLKVSSNYAFGNNKSAWGASKALDNNPSTEWASNGDGDKAFIEVQLAKPGKVKEVEIWSRAMRDGTAIIRSFQITTDKGQTFGPFDLPDTKKAYRFPIKTEAKSLRLDVKKSTGGNTGLKSFGVYE